jgi:hypothetical protein
MIQLICGAKSPLPYIRRLTSSFADGLLSDEGLKAVLKEG